MSFSSWEVLCETMARALRGVERGQKSVGVGGSLRLGYRPAWPRGSPMGVQI